MDKIAAGSATDRRDLFSESASQLGMNPAIVEKDFWVLVQKVTQVRRRTICCADCKKHQFASRSMSVID
jgi:hypothetical protein